ncbi:Fructose-bisphosphate aldolase class II [hydrothermal vent metagenome]|uniref:Fructose-bisphosphate aldolase class II n=1 Tax=hydrothermal vent metagenome TaxID=652676 RepID=A0A3B1AWK5_9ZZZZ
MPLVDMKEMLRHAYDHGYAVGAFDLLSLDFLQGIMAAAERARAPVILSLSESHFDDFGFELMMPAVEAAAGRASVPVAIHLNHGASLDSAVRAINRGCNGVMVDASHQPLRDHIATSREIVAMAHACGVPVEGDLGYVPGGESEDADTLVAEAQAYVEKTGVDFLAVSIGSVHGDMKDKPTLDWQRLKQINEALDIPLVIRGASGLCDDQFRRLIGNGVAKINDSTVLADVAGATIRNAAKSCHDSGYTALLASIREAIATEAEHGMRRWGSAGRAAEVLSCCRSWTPVEHLIIYNIEGLDETGVERMMAEGRRVLGAIPGVREVVTGKAVQEKAKYRYTWLVRFCHPAVIDSYREHPDHVAFADELFRPVAGKQRISIDYQSVETVFSM